MQDRRPQILSRDIYGHQLSCDVCYNCTHDSILSQLIPNLSLHTGDIPIGHTQSDLRDMHYSLTMSIRGTSLYPAKWLSENRYRSVNHQKLKFDTK